MVSSPIDDNKSDNDSNSIQQQVALEEEKKVQKKANLWYV